MSKDLHFSVLLDFYGDMLTDKQKDVMELYYNQDLSLAEISEHEGITRQGVRDNIKRGEAYLTELEEKLHFAEKITRLIQVVDRVTELCGDIERTNEGFTSSAAIEEDSIAIRTMLNDYIDDNFS